MSANPAAPFPETNRQASEPPSGIRIHGTDRSDPQAALDGLLRGPLPRPESWARALRVSAHDAEDLIQDALLALVEKPETQPRSLRGWLFGAARLGRRRLGRARARASLYEPQIEAYLRDVGESPPSPYDEIDQRERLLAVFWLLDQVKPARRLAAERCLFGESSEDLAAELGLPLGTVKSQWRRAKADMRAALDREMAKNSDKAWLVALFTLVATLWLQITRRARSRSGPLLACASLAIITPAHAALRGSHAAPSEDATSRAEVPLPSLAVVLPAWAERERESPGALSKPEPPDATRAASGLRPPAAAVRAASGLRPPAADARRSLRIGRTSEAPADQRLTRSAHEQRRLANTHAASGLRPPAAAVHAP